MKKRGAYHLAISFTLPIAMAMAVCGCATPRQAAQLATLTSAQVNALNLQLEMFVAAANQSRSNDALRIAATRIYYQSLDDTAMMEVRSWKDDPNDSRSKIKVAAFSALQQDGRADLLAADSAVAQPGGLQSVIQTQYGQMSYSPSKLNEVVASLEAISKSTSRTGEISAIYAFSKSIVSSSKDALSASTLNPNGVSTKTSVLKP